MDEIFDIWRPVGFYAERALRRHSDRLSRILRDPRSETRPRQSAATGKSSRWRAAVDAARRQRLQRQPPRGGDTARLIDAWAQRAAAHTGFGAAEIAANDASFKDTSRDDAA